MKLNTGHRVKIWKLPTKRQQPTDVAKAARRFLECERELDYVGILFRPRSLQTLTRPGTVPAA